MFNQNVQIYDSRATRNTTGILFHIYLDIEANKPPKAATV